jgi:DNA-binding MarR family transcriptional regulator
MDIKKSKLENIAQSVRDELGEETSVSVYVKKKVPKQSTYVMFYQQVNLELVKELQPNACKVLLYLMSKTQYDNYIGVNQETIQEELGYSSIRSVQNALKELKSLHIILTMPDLDDKRRNVYFINPFQSWKGKVAKRIEAVKRLAEANGEQLSLPFTERTELL